MKLLSTTSALLFASSANVVLGANIRGAKEGNEAAAQHVVRNLVVSQEH